jgi:hypothetical protein
MSTYPKHSIQLCIALTKSGLTAYGSPEALKRLAQQLLVVANAPPGDHYEIHTSAAIAAADTATPASCVLVHPEIAPLLDRGKKSVVDGVLLEHAEFELTFMVVTNDELREMERYGESGLLPPNWNDQD